jgi:hypothetical protein
LLKNCLVLEGMGGRVWWRATEPPIACTSKTSHYTELLLIQIVSSNETVTTGTDTWYSHMENCPTLLLPEPASYTCSTVKWRVHINLYAYCTLYIGQAFCYSPEKVFFIYFFNKCT